MLHEDGVGRPGVIPVARFLRFVAAERLDISPGSVRRLRWLLKSGDVGSGG